MGLLSVGKPLSWQETEKVADYIRQHGIIQFLNIYKNLKSRKGDVLKWGDEVEYSVVKFDHINKTAKLHLGCEQIVENLSENERAGLDCEVLWRPEFASFQIESTPGRPYGSLLAHFNLVEPSMKLRRKIMKEYLKNDDIKMMSISNFPRLGCGPSFTSPDLIVDGNKPFENNSKTKSIFFPEDAINQHPRFKTLANNIRSRRGRKVDIKVPIFQDKNTPNPFYDNKIKMCSDQDSKTNGLNEPNVIYMDSMGFGMGMNCLQMTFQAQNLCEARSLYDQLNAFGPIILALSASTPIFRGMLANIDARWQVIVNSVDDRKFDETVKKSRYDTISYYLDKSSQFCNNVDIEINKEIYKTLIDNKIDPILSKHLAHLFIRDPISVFKENLNVDDETSSDHFENIQSTNWQSMRFKPPPPNSPIGWRVEFRTTDLQISDFENAAFVCFVVLATRALIAHGYRTCIPITLADENMKRAHSIDAVTQQKFYWRTNFCKNVDNIEDAKIQELTIDDIINGNNKCKGIKNLIESYLSDMDVDIATTCTLDPYLDFISKRASGDYITNARYTRNFVRSHPEYKFDSQISERINYDLLVNLQDIAEGKVSPGVHNMFNNQNITKIQYKDLTPGTRRVYGNSTSGTQNTTMEQILE